MQLGRTFRSLPRLTKGRFSRAFRALRSSARRSGVVEISAISTALLLATGWIPAPVKAKKKKPPPGSAAQTPAEQPAKWGTKGMGPGPYLDPPK